MNKLKLKEYHRPYMIIEAFAPNEFIASCVKKSNLWVINGKYGMDKNGNHYFDAGEDDNFGSIYYAYSWLIPEGKFEIKETGFHQPNGQAYLFLGTDFYYDPDGYLGDDPNYFNYDNKSNWATVLYAKIEYHPDNGGYQRETLYIMDDGTNTVTNAS